MEIKWYLNRIIIMSAFFDRVVGLGEGALRLSNGHPIGFKQSKGLLCLIEVSAMEVLDIFLSSSLSLYFISLSLGDSLI